jgi:hypothetical protein
MYDRVIADDALKDRDGISGDSTKTRAILTAFAHHRLVNLFAVQEQDDEARGTLHRMTELYPAGHELHAFVEMTEAFLRAYESVGLDAGCAAAIAYAEDHTDSLMHWIGTYNFGSSYGFHSTEDVCLQPAE